MPFKSKAQQAFFNANRASLERQGVNVSEWNAATKGKSLPARVEQPKSLASLSRHLPPAKTHRDR